MRAPTKTLKRARSLRRTMTLPEVLLWRALKGRAVDGLQFRKQHPIGPYVLDFYCSAARLAVEVDGAHHGGAPERSRDDRRDRWLAERGVRTLRLPAAAVIEDPDAAVQVVRAAALERAPSTASRSPSPAVAVED